jgi:hypothetical protein
MRNVFFAARTEAQGLEPWVLPPSAGVDSDGDGLSDSAELGLGSNPLDPDSDDDGLLDGVEDSTTHTGVLDADSDDDGASDGAEVAAGTDPREPTSVPPPPLPVPALPGAAELALAALLLATLLARYHEPAHERSARQLCEPGRPQPDDE